MGTVRYGTVGSGAVCHGEARQGQAWEWVRARRMLRRARRLVAILEHRAPRPSGGPVDACERRMIDVPGQYRVFIAEYEHHD